MCSREGNRRAWQGQGRRKKEEGRSQLETIFVGGDWGQPWSWTASRHGVVLKRKRDKSWLSGASSYLGASSCGVDVMGSRETHPATECEWCGREEDRPFPHPHPIRRRETTSRKPLTKTRSFALTITQRT